MLIANKHHSDAFHFYYNRYDHNIYVHAAAVFKNKMFSKHNPTSTSTDVEFGNKFPPALLLMGSLVYLLCLIGF